MRAIERRDEKLYACECFEVSVDLEPVWKASGGVTSTAPQGFVAVVQIRAAGASRLMADTPHGR
jgi:hypothetical protein